MTQEQKELLQDLCGRLPYGIKVEVCVKDKDIKSVDNVKYDTVGTYIRLIDDKKFSVKPYLRPLSSMTEEELYDWTHTWIMDSTVEKYDWLNAHHFDYRGLIEKGLALESPKGMYEF